MNVALSRSALRDVRSLSRHYVRLGRSEAVVNLIEAVEAARTRIAANAQHGLSAPRPYPELAKPGTRWIRQGRYWIGYSDVVPYVIRAVFHDQADIPSRL